jgi:hypothetical protein
MTSTSLVNVTDLSSVTTGKNATQITGALTFVNTTNMSSANYQSKFSIFATATNVSGTVTKSDGKDSVLIVYDPKSASALANSKTLNTLLITQTNGYRLYSSTTAGKEAVNGTSVTLNNTPANYVTNYYGNGQYDNSKSLTQAGNHENDLMLYDGNYTTNPLAYINYTQTYYSQTLPNTVDYSGISKTTYRYATFAWEITSSTTPINFITINLNNSSSTLTGNGTSWYTDTTKTKKLYLYYRVEDTANTTVNWTNISSPWIDGNSFGSTTVSNGGYSTGQTYPSTTQNLNLPTPMANTTQTTTTLSGLTTQPLPDSSSTNTAFTVKLSNPISQYNKSASAMYLYVRIGVHMTDTFSFGNPTALISNQAIGAGFPSTGVAFTGATADTTTVGTFKINSIFTTPTPFFTDTNKQLGNVNGTVVGLPIPTINFNYTYTPLSNSVRYVSGTANGVYNTTAVVVTGISTHVTTTSSYSILQTAVYPDTVYKVKGTSITNSSGLTTSVTGSEVTIETATSGFDITYFTDKSYTSASDATKSLTTTITNKYSAKFVTGGTTTNLISTKTGTTLSTNDIGSINVHNSYSTRGSVTDSALVTLNATFTKGTTNVGTDTMSIKGFGRAIIPSTASIIKINTPTITDLGTNQYLGYYNSATGVTVSNSTTFSSTFSTTSADPYKLTLTVTYPSGNNGIASGGSANSNPVVVTYTSPNFYYDGEMAIPTVSIANFTITGSNYTIISGINIYNSTSIPLSYTLDATNLGTNFYNATRTIAYTTTTDSSLTRATEISYFSTATSLTNTITLTTLPSGYKTQTVTLNTNSYNIVDTPSTTSTSTTTIIYDPLSIAIVNAQYLATATTLASSSSFTIVQNTPIQGCRLWSSTTVGLETTLANSTEASLINYVSYEGTSYSSVATPYDNTKDISSVATPTYKYEVLLTNGLYTTVPAYYKSYTSNGATYNYSTLGDNAKTINGYKYVTFGWKIGSISTQCKTVTFTITGCASSDTLSASSGEFVVGTNKLLLYYRVEDATSITTITNFTRSGAVSTVWINGNSLSGTLFSASSYNNPGAGTTIYTTNNYIGLASNTSCSYDGNGSVTFTEVLANPLTNTVNPYYLYCRMGLPSNFSFTGITANLST